MTDLFLWLFLKFWSEFFGCAPILSDSTDTITDSRKPYLKKSVFPMIYLLPQKINFDQEAKKVGVKYKVEKQLK